MICDELHPNCLLRVKCSKKCYEVIDYTIHKRFKIQNNFKESYKSLTYKHECPVCKYNMFYMKHQLLLHYDTIELECTFCNTNFHLSLRKNEDKSFNLVGIGMSQRGLIDTCPIFSLEKINELRQQRIKEI